MADALYPECYSRFFSVSLNQRLAASLVDSKFCSALMPAGVHIPLRQWRGRDWRAPHITGDTAIEHGNGRFFMLYL